MITINNVTMGFTQCTLFKDVSLSIFKNEKIGLTGPNGAGKTTLFSIILGDIEPVAGSVQMQKNLNIGYLPQESHFSSTKTVMGELTEGDDRIKKLMEEKHQLEDAHKADSDRYGDILHELEILGIYDLEHRAEKILIGLGFKQSDFSRPIKELSGGWQMRTLLAKLLTYSYDLLLLDEPTNYLDLEATLWLKDFLANYNGSFVLISHDRVFLNDVTNYTIILENARMTKVKGNYEAYEMQKDLTQRSLEKQQKVIDKKRDQLEKFAQRFHAQPNRASAVRNKRKMLERLEDVELAHEHRSIGEFEFSNIQSTGYVVLQLENVSKAYGEKQVYKDFNFEMTRGQRICLVGPNGAGKSTLLKMIAGVLPLDKGRVKYGYQVEVGYFSQSRLDVLNPVRTAFEEVTSATTQSVPALKIRSLLGLFNFHGDDVFKQVKILSGGEKSRLILAKLLINPPNFMLLDEPTTHLDIDGVKALTNAFKEFDGTLCFISHDLFFIKEIADCIVEVDGGGVKTYLGGLDYYLEKKKHLEDVKIEEKKKNQKEETKVRQKAAEKKASSPVVDDLHERHNQALKRLADIKGEIKKLEQEKENLETESYIKSRMLTQAYETKSQEKIKEYGQRLKWVTSRLREIEALVKNLEEEKLKISK